MVTWNELIRQIKSEIPESERDKEVQYREPYDDPEIFELRLFKAAEDLSDPEGEVKIKKNEFFLQ